MSLVFDGIVDGLSTIVKSVAGVDAGTLVVAGIVIAGLIYAANRFGYIKIEAGK